MTPQPAANGSRATAQRDAEAKQQSEQALARYKARMRRARVWYAGAISIVVVAVAAVVIVVLRRGEVAHVTYKPAAHAPASITPAPTGNNLQHRWSTADDTAAGTPFAGGTVITYNRHTVRGRNARTGAVTWSYSRSDRTVCAAVQSSDVTVAIYRRSGSCDEVSAFTTPSGRRAWTRTLDEDAALFDGPATFQVDQGTLLLVSRTSVYAVAISTGVDYWVLNRPGCSIQSAALSQSGALIAMQCAHQSCPGQLFCQQGPQLLFRPASNPAGVSQAQQDKNPDYIVWDVPNLPGRTPISTDMPAAVNPTSNTLDVFNAANGKTSRSLPLGRSQSSSNRIVANSSSGVNYVWYRGYIYALSSDSPTFSWQAQAVNPPTVSTDLGTPARIYVDDTGLVSQLDADNGRVLHRFRLTALPSAATTTYPLGTGLLSAGSTTSYYDLS